MLMKFKKIFLSLTILPSLFLFQNFTVYDPDQNSDFAIQMTDIMPNRTNRPFQGMVLLKSTSKTQTWLFTQDLKKEKNSPDDLVENNIFNIVEVDQYGHSKLIKTFSKASESHLQSVIKKKSRCASGKRGYKLFTPGAKFKGLHMFCLEEDFSHLDDPVIKEVIVKLGDKEVDLKFSAIDFDFGGEVAVAVGENQGVRKIYVLNLKQLITKELVDIVHQFPLADKANPNDKWLVDYLKNNGKEKNSIQGLAISKQAGADQIVYVLAGSSDLNTPKYLIKYDFISGKRIDVRSVKSAISYARNEGGKWEPEGLFYAKGLLYYTMSTYGLGKTRNRMYALPEEKF
jgi:hypothetical protein